MSAATKLFSDLNGETIELRAYVNSMPNADFAKAFPGVKGKRYDSFSMKVARAPDGRELPVTRSIFFKSNPSRHECDARCINASGRVMNCECKCGGKNHGRGAFAAVEVA